MTTTTLPRPVEKLLTGGAVWKVPESVFEIMWIGPGAGLHFGQPRKAGGMITRIDHPSADGSYDTMREASAAVAAFIAVCEEAQNVNIICDGQPMPHPRYQECANARPLPAVLTHSHGGGRIHNHEQYSAEEMPADFAGHSHAFREDWN